MGGIKSAIADKVYSGKRRWTTHSCISARGGGHRKGRSKSASASSSIQATRAKGTDSGSHGGSCSIPRTRSIRASRPGTTQRLRTEESWTSTGLPRASQGSRFGCWQAEGTWSLGWLVAKGGADKRGVAVEGTGWVEQTVCSRLGGRDRETTAGILYASFRSQARPRGRLSSLHRIPATARPRVIDVQTARRSRLNVRLPSSREHRSFESSWRHRL